VEIKGCKSEKAELCRSCGDQDQVRAGEKIGEGGAGVTAGWWGNGSMRETEDREWVVMRATGTDG
jgi:hypothetical protein